MATGGYFREVRVAEQKHDSNGILFPLVLSPNSDTISTTAETEMSVFQEAIKAEKQRLEALLTKSGAILFRDFPVSSPSDFNDVVEAFGFPEATYLGGQAPRTKVVGRVYTTNESPLERKIPFHHELAYVPDSPSKLFFFCEEEPGSGGQTPIVLSHIVYDKMKESHPEFVARVEEHGLIYIKVTTSEDRPSSYMGRSWMSTYRTHEKSVAEERAAKLGTKLEWIGNDVKAITGPLPAFRLDKGNQRKTWFNNLAISNTHPMNGKLDNLDTFVEIGNGDLVPDDVKEDCLRILEEECVAIPWKKGDVLLVDNFMVLHARQPLLKPPRSILVSLCN